MISFIEQAKSYTTLHQNAIGRYSHWAGVPLILLSLMILLGFVRIVILNVVDINLAHLAVLALLLLYFRLNWKLAAAATPVLLILLWIAHFFSSYGPSSFALWSFLVFFIFGFGMVFAGFLLVNKTLPSLKHLKTLWIAPLVITAEVFFIFGWMGSLKTALFQPEEVNLKQ